MPQGHDAATERADGDVGDDVISTPWDRLLAARTAALCVLLTVLASAVLVATDEREATFHARLARLCALAPALASLSLQILAKRLDTTGELRALAAVGLTRHRALRGAIVFAVSFGLLAALVLALEWGSLDGLFPPPSGALWQQQGRGFVGPGLLLERADGDVTFVAAASTSAAVRHPRALVAASIALFAFALPAWIATVETWAVRIGVLLALVLGAIVAFHAVSAGGSAALLLLPPFALLAYLAAHALRLRLHDLRPSG